MTYIRTTEHRLLQSQQIRATQPWKHSTGPKTARGKAVASLNAAKGYERPRLREIARALRGLKAAKAAQFQAIYGTESVFLN